MKLIGKQVTKVDGLAKCKGITKFADDIFLPGMLYCKVLRSIHPHALIKKIDYSKALKMPGVKAVITGKDLPIKFGIMPISEDEHALAVDKVRYVGDPVVAVAALDEDTAEEALEQIYVEYEPLKSIMTIEDALFTNEPRIHEYGDGPNIHKKVCLEFGQVDKNFDSSDLIQEDIFFYEGNNHLPMEQHSAVAFWDGKRLTLWSATQTPHYVHKALAKVLAIPATQIRVIAAPVGGGFGGKSDPFSHEVVVSKLSMITGRPIKITLTREEVFYAHRGRHPVLMWIKTGVKDGKITAMDFKTFLDGGSHGSYGVASTYYTGALQTTTYKIPTYRFQGVRVFTNKPPCGPKRGHGTPQPRFGLEIQIDKIAEKLGQDPVEFRKQILTGSDHITANWLKLGSNGLAQCIEKVEKASDWKNKFRKLPRGHGVGFAVSSYLSGAGLPIYWNDMPHTGVQLKLDRSGLVTAFCGAIDIGQGSDTVLATVVAEVLGIDPNKDVVVVTADTDTTPIDLGSYSSRVTLMMGNAAIEASSRVKEILAKAAGEKLGVPQQRLIFSDGRVADSANPEVRMTFQQAIIEAEARFGTVGSVGSYKPPRSHARYKGGGVGPSPAYSFSACVVQVEIDLETGIVKPEKFWVAHDIGRAINPTLVIGQVEGSVYMGLGEALMEEQIFRHGVHKIPSILEYKSPTTFEMPPVETFLVEDQDPNGPFGAKEAGQGPLLPVPPAIANAVYDAIRVRIDEIPITPDKVLKAMKKGRVGPTSVPQIEYPKRLRVLTPEEGGDGTGIQEELVVYRGGRS